MEKCVSSTPASRPASRPAFRGSFRERLSARAGPPPPRPLSPRRSRGRAASKSAGADGGSHGIPEELRKAGSHWHDTLHEVGQGGRCGQPPQKKMSHLGGRGECRTQKSQCWLFALRPPCPEFQCWDFFLRLLSARMRGRPPTLPFGGRGGKPSFAVNCQVRHFFFGGWFAFRAFIAAMSLAR